MFKELQITLYDIFGYLLPGAIIIATFVVLFWTFFWPTAPLSLHSDLPLPAVVCTIFIAYLAGHLGQGVGNLMEKLPSVKRTLEETLPLSAELSELVHNAVAARFGEKARSLKPKELSVLCDQALVHAGSPGEREIFVYREGFYRGSSVALAFLGLTLILRLVWSPTLLALGPRTVEIHRGELALAALMVGFGAWLSFRRYLRFACHKNICCMARFLALVAGQSNAKESKPS